MINKYNTFKEKLLLEGIINESRIYYSKPLFRILSHLDNDISKDLLSIRGEDIKPDITFINNEKDGYFTFITMKNAENLISNRYNKATSDKISKTKDIYDTDLLWDYYEAGRVQDSAEIYSKSRNDMRIGKLINNIFPGKYTASQIEEFVNAFKAATDKISEKFEIVFGEDINKWYWYENYAKQMGPLGNSCMRGKKGIFSIYTSNPEVCRLLVLRENDKIWGRALVWKLDSINNDKIDTQYIMDRIYTIRDSDINKFQKFASDQGWAYKTKNTYTDKQWFTYKGDTILAKATIKVKEMKYTTFPFMDTFSRYDPRTYTLFNDSEESKINGGHYILHRTDGTYALIPGGPPEEGMVYSDWEGRNITQEDAVFSDPLDTWLIRASSVRIDSGTMIYRGWYPEDHGSIYWDDFDDMFIHGNDAIWCDSIDTYILISDHVKVVESIDSYGNVDKIGNWHKDDRRIMNFSHIGGDWKNRIRMVNDYIVKDILIDNVNGMEIPKSLAVELYRTVKNAPKNLLPVKLLSEIDASLLDYEIDKSEKMILDQYEYHDILDESEVTTELKSKLDELMEKLPIKIKRSKLEKNIEKNQKLLNEVNERDKKIKIFSRIIPKSDYKPFWHKYGSNYYDDSW